MEDRIIAELNAELGSKIDNLARSQDLVDKYVDQLNSIEEKVKKLCVVIFVYVNIHFVANTHQRQSIASSQENSCGSR